MDGTKRKASGGSPPRDYSKMYFGFTPPHALPATLQAESALRYTISPASYPCNPVSQPHGIGAAYTHYDSEPITEHVSGHGDSAAGDQQHEGQRLDSMSTDDMTSDNDSLGDNDDDSIHVDTENDNDQVYILNAADSSWCGTLPSEDDPDAHDELPCQAILALQHLKRAQELAAEQQRITQAANAAAAIPLLDQDSPPTHDASISAAQWNKDLMLRTKIRQIKRALANGATLTIHKLRLPTPAPYCSYPLCTENSKTIPTEAHYLTLNDGHGSTSHYCLPCLEDLWNGTELTGPMPPPRVLVTEIQEVQNLIFSLDGFNQPGWIPQSLLTSKHAPATFPIPERSLSPYGRTTPPPTTPCIMPDTTPSPTSPAEQSPRSTTSTGEWLKYPTRFQHLSPFITIGEGLSDAEKAAVEMWKAASDEQIDWIDFREKYTRTVDELTRKDADENEDTIEFTTLSPMCENETMFPSAYGRNVAVVQDIVEHKTCQQIDNVRKGLETDRGEFQPQPTEDELKAKKQCRGQNLSVVLARLSSS